MKDELHKQIIQGLSGELDGNTFEAAAVDLLQSIYPSLTPVKGGGDGGRDGHFFDINGMTGVLVCTTGQEVGANLRKNLQEYAKKGHKGRSVIVATSQRLTPARQDKLEEIAKAKGFRLIKIHEQSDFALRLYRDKTWLKKLLNLESNQQALSVNPMTSRPLLSLSVRGREDVFEWLSKTTGDSLLVGQPGSGKTFVVRHFIMENDGLFVVSDNRDQITAEVRAKKPNYLVIDDAHTKPEMIQTLRQIREDIGADFKIIATGWLSYKDPLQNDLVIADGAIFEVELQGRDIILEIIKDCGVKSPHTLLYQMVTQSEGKPGLAATLSQLVLAGNAQEVYIGDALGKHLVALFEKELGSDALDLLAVVAMGGNAGITLKDAADILGISEIKAGNLAAKLSFGGVIVDLQPDAISVRPAPLRYYLAKKVFFKSGAAIDPTKHLSSYKNLSDVVEVMLNAGLRGGTVDKDALYVLIEKTGIPSLFGGFAIFGKPYAIKVITEHPEAALKAPHDLLSVYPEGILPLMLDAAVGDNRPLNAHPEHPFRIIQDWCKNVDQGYYDPVPRRKALMKVLINWKKAGKDSSVFTQGLVYAFGPNFEIHRNDPGAGNSISWGGGHLTAHGMRLLLEEWPTIKPLLTDLPNEAWYHLVDLLEEWVYEQRALGGNTPSKEQGETLHKGAVIIIDDLTELSAVQPGIQARLRELAHHLKHRIKSTTDREYDIIFPHEEDRRDWQKNAAKQAKRARLLASEYALQTPKEVIGKLVQVNQQAAAARKTYPDHTSTIAHELSGTVTDLAAWADVSITKWHRSDVSFPFLHILQAKDPKAAKPLLIKALQDERHRYAAVEVVLRRPFDNDELWEATYPLLSGMSRLADILVLRQQIDEETTARLLKYPTGDVGLMVADAIAHLSNGSIPSAILPLWEEAIINYKFDDGNNNDHHVSNALKSHPATIVKWLLAKVAEEPTDWFDRFSREAINLIPQLSQEQRVEVIRSLPDTGRAELVAHELVETDITLFKEILANKNTRRYQLKALSHVDGAEWVHFTELALEVGWDEDEIVSQSTSSDGWSGSAAEYWLRRKTRFDEGLKANNPRVVTIAQKGIATYQSLHEYAVVSEKKRALNGSDR